MKLHFALLVLRNAIIHAHSQLIPQKMMEFSLLKFFFIFNIILKTGMHSREKDRFFFSSFLQQTTHIVFVKTESIKKNIFCEIDLSFPKSLKKKELYFEDKDTHVQNEKKKNLLKQNHLPQRKCFCLTVFNKKFFYKEPQYQKIGMTQNCDIIFTNPLYPVIFVLNFPAVHNRNFLNDHIAKQDDLEYTFFSFIASQNSIAIFKFLLIRHEYLLLNQSSGRTL